MSTYDAAARAVPAEFRAGVETQHGEAGRLWLDGLPALLESVCRRWELALVEVEPRHGYLGVVWRVEQAGQSYALKLTIPSEAFTIETAALVAWDGRSMVRLIQHDAERGAALLQWLDSSVSLAEVPLDEAVAVAGKMLTVTPTTDRTAYFGDARADALQGCKTWPARNDALGNYFSTKMLQATEAAVLRVATHPESVLVNHDLHYANVIRDWYGNWVCIDPKPTTGPPEYAIAPLIWRRYNNPTDSLARLDRFCDIATLDRDLAFDWLLVRLVAYALWALESGLTTDPALCRELVDRMTSRG